MFIPKEFEITDRAEVLAFIRRYNFGVIVSQADGAPVATHLPFHVMERDGEIVLTAHFARANAQWKGIEEQLVMVIFSQPHAYISPSHYDKEQSVPTWNYVAVHAYGRCEVITDTTKGLGILEQMIQQSEPGYMAQWERLDEKYKLGMYKGIVPVEITVTATKAAGKLSQNKTEAERQRIIDTLGASDDSAERDVAEYMKRGM
ncbi:MAG: FMN-binding negative transcriptional regulator [Pseudomonadota bacterium]